MTQRSVRGLARGGTTVSSGVQSNDEHIIFYTCKLSPVFRSSYDIIESHGDVKTMVV